MLLACRNRSPRNAQNSSHVLPLLRHHERETSAYLTIFSYISYYICAYQISNHAQASHKATGCLGCCHQAFCKMPDLRGYHSEGCHRMVFDILSRFFYMMASSILLHLCPTNFFCKIAAKDACCGQEGK